MLFQSSRKNIPGEQDPGELGVTEGDRPIPFPFLIITCFLTFVLSHTRTPVQRLPIPHYQLLHSQPISHQRASSQATYLPLETFFLVYLSPTRMPFHRLPIPYQKVSSQATYLPVECLFTGYLSPTRDLLPSLPISHQNAFSQVTYPLLESFFKGYLSSSRCLFTGYLSPTRNLLPSLPISHQNAFSQATYPPLESFFTGYKNEKSEDYSKADLKQRVLFFIKIFRLAIPAFFRFTDVTGYLSSSRMPFHRLPIFY